MRRILIRNGRIIDPANEIDTTGDLLIRDGKIDRIDDQIEVEASETVDANGANCYAGFGRYARSSP